MGRTVTVPLVALSDATTTKVREDVAELGEDFAARTCLMHVRQVAHALATPMDRHDAGISLALALAVATAPAGEL